MAIKKVAKKVVKKAVKKVVKKVAPKKVAKQAPVKSVEVVVVETPVFKKSMFEGRYTITRVLGSGHTKTHYHCAAKEGDTNVTVHVPKTLFN